MTGALFSALGQGFLRGLLGAPPAAPTRSSPAPRPPPPDAGVRIARATANKKLAPLRYEKGTELVPLRPVPVAPFCAATSVSIDATCQDSCPFKGNGCFADAGFTRIQSKKMDQEAARLTGLEVGKREAELIDRTFPYGVPQDGARGGRDLRLHVGGDASGVGAARALAGAAERWRGRGGGAVWTFTHAWRSIPRKAWGDVAVLASVETELQARQAFKAGYAPALVVADFPAGDKAWDIGGGVKAIPCPAETRGKTCVECRLCLDQDLVALKRGIAFRVHGQQAERARQALAEAA